MNKTALLVMMSMLSGAAWGATPKEAQRESENLAAQAWQAWQGQNFTEAETAFAQAVEKDPDNANAWNGLGWSQMNQGKAEAAQEAFERCLKVDPRQAAALNGLGWIAKNQGKTEEALKHWKKAVDSLPSATAAAMGLAQTYEELKQFDEAAKYYRLVLKYDPQNADVKRQLENLEKPAP